MTVHPRTLARRLAFETLFELASREGSSLDDVLLNRESVLHEESGVELRESDLAFARELAAGTLAERTAIDQRIAGVAPAFPIDQLPVTDRAVLELAIFELLHMRETPVQVAINEAVEMAKTFGGESSGRFVNGVLGTIAEGLTADGRPGRRSRTQSSGRDTRTPGR